jgi:hypothetical protein
MSQIKRTFASAVGIGLALHTLHEAMDGFEWAASICPCRFLRDR